MLFELISARYERRSLLITANQPFGSWDETFPDKAMTVAAIDRLADGLPSDIRESVRKTVRAAAQAHPGVPKGMTVGF